MIRRLLSLLAPVALSTAAVAASPPTPVQTYVQAPGPLGPLKGTMLSPASGRLAMMLIIPGSGPTDRDGNNPLGVRGGTCRLLPRGWPSAASARSTSTSAACLPAARRLPTPMR